MRRPARFFLASIALATSLAAACGDGGGGEDKPDAKDNSCTWPGTSGTTPGGTVTLGDAQVEGTFRPLVDHEPFRLQAGLQGGEHFAVKSRIEGLEPGDPTDPRAEGNPLTLYTLFDGSGNVIYGGQCPETAGYTDIGGGVYETPNATRLVMFGEDFNANFDKEMTIRVEVIDKNGLYAKGENIVLTKAPPELTPDAGPNDPDAGVDVDAGQ